MATIARLLCRELTLQNEYLRQENRILKSKVKGRIRFDDEERRSLVDAALAMGRKLMRQVVTIVKPDTILKWQRRLERDKWDYSKRRRCPGGHEHRPTSRRSSAAWLARTSGAMSASRANWSVRPVRHPRRDTNRPARRSDVLATQPVDAATGSQRLVGMRRPRH
jgi:hypothetical protein